MTPPKKTTKHASNSPQGRRQWLVCAALVLVTAAVYSRACFNEFVNFDDTIYATANHHVQEGLTVENVQWALTSMEYANWHPLTWLSLELDSTLFGFNASGFHATNVLLHLANSVLLFLVLHRATGALAASGATAALFALHPLHVESVAWVAERKDVLSSLFWLLTMAVYGRYVARPSIGRYATVVTFFALGLAAKPMLVTLPCVLLLWDVWPLRRWPGKAERETGRVDYSARLYLVLEKVPLLLLSAVSSVISVLAQRRMGAMPSVEVLSIGERLQHVPLAYAEYLIKTILPRDLAVYYPYGHLRHLVGLVVGSTLLLAIVTLWALRRLRRQPYLAVGWLWYLGTFVPVIGLVQVGAQAIADRYTYIPLIGIFIAIAWATEDLVARGHLLRWPVAIAFTVVLIVLTSYTWTQIGYWHDSIALWQHASAVTAQSPRVYASLGDALVEKRRYMEAMPYLHEALRAGNDDGAVHTNLGVALFNLGQFAQSEEEFNIALRLNARDDKALYNLGCARLFQRNPSGAVAAFEETLKTNPYQWRAHLALAETLAGRGAAAEAQAHFQRALEIDREGSLASWRKAHPAAADAAALAEQAAGHHRGTD